MDKKRRFLVLIALIVALALLSLSCSAGVEEPGESAAFPTDIGPSEEQPSGALTPVPTLAPTPMPAIPERRLMVLEWPQAIRTGDSDWVRLKLEMDEQGQLTPVAETPGSQVQGQPVEVPNVYDTHEVYVVAQLRIAGMQVEPPEYGRERLLPGRSFELVWSVRPEAVGTYRGTVSAHLEFEPVAAGAAHLGSILLPAQTFEIEGINLLGLGGTPARLVGLIGTFAGSVLGLDNLISWFWGRFRKRGVRRGGESNGRD